MSLLRKQHVENEVINGLQFRKIHINDIIFQCNEKDSCFKTCDNTIAVLKNIVQVQNEIFFIRFSYSTTGNVYEYPLPSSYLGILKVSNQNEERQIFPLSQIARKCWVMPDGDGYICVPLLHSVPLFK